MEIRQFSFFIVATTLIGTLFIAGCGTNSSQQKLNNSIPPSPSLSILETPEESSVEIPPKSQNSELPPIETPTFPKTIKSSL